MLRCENWTGAVLAFSDVYAGDITPAWPVLALLGAQTSYTRLTCSTAAKIERTLNVGSTLRRDLR